MTDSDYLLSIRPNANQDQQEAFTERVGICMDSGYDEDIARSVALSCFDYGSLGYSEKCA